MVTFNTRVSTTDGSRVRGLEQQIKPGVSAEDAARALLTRVGGEGALTRLKQDFDFRLISRGG